MSDFLIAIINIVLLVAHSNPVKCMLLIWPYPLLLPLGLAVTAYAVLLVKQNIQWCRLGRACRLHYVVLSAVTIFCSVIQVCVYSYLVAQEVSLTCPLSK